MSPPVPPPIRLSGPPPFWSNPVPMWIFEQGTLRFLDVNDAAVATYGWSRDDFLRMTIRDIRSPAEAARLDRWRAEQKRHDTTTGPWVHRDAHGRERLVEINACPVIFQDRDAILVSVLDRTAEFDANVALSAREAELRERAEMLRLAMAAGGIGTFRRDIVAGTVEVSAEARALHGSLPPGNPLRMEDWLAHMVPEDRARIEADIAIAFARRAPGITVDYRLRDPETGAIRHMEARADYEYAQDGTPLTAIGVIINVSARKAAEKALADSEQRYRSVVETAADGIVIADALGRIVTANAATLHMFGYASLAEMVGRDLGMLLPPEHARRGAHYVATLRTGAPPRVLGLQDRELMAQRRDGSRFPIELSVGSFVVDGVMHLTGIIRDVTERRRAEAALAESDMRLRLTHEAAGIGIWEIDLDRRVTRFSPETARLYGLAPDHPLEFPREQWRRIVHPSDADMAKWQPDAERGAFAPFDVTFRVPQRDGSLRWLQGIGRAIPGPDGAPVRILGVNIDVTARRMLEERVRESEERLRLTVEATGEGLWDCHIPSGRASFTEPFVAMLGYALHEVEQDVSFWQSRVHPDDMPEVRRHLDAHFQGATSAYVSEHRLRHRDGHWVWVLDRGRVVEREPDGQPLRMLGTLQDITARKALETALAEGEARIRAILEAVPMAVAKIGPDGAIGAANAAAAALLGDAPRLLELLAPEDRAAWQAAHARVCAGETVQWEVDLAGRDGERHRVDASGVPFPLAGGGTGHLAVLRDVTAMREAEARLRRLEAEAMRASRLGAMGAMAAGLAHELNQPLGAMMNYTGAAAMLAGRAVMAEEERARLAALLEKASAQALRASGIVKRLRDFIGRADREVTALRVADLFEEVRAEALQRREAEIAISVAPPGLQIFGDAVQLRQVIANLLANAVEAAPPGCRPQISIEACRGWTGEGVEIVVRDCGPGIPPEVRRRLFEPVVSSKPDGMGIGLAMCRAIVEAHGGSIWAAPEAPGGGAAFHVLVPDEEQALLGSLKPAAS
ncbi:PAS domain S-box protein [Neoroseomonas rubea]|uniref:PAS domain S-box protein n=1 Tax=Neoroseomonas rubea TaxID=2748666 RepID=UPI0018DFF5A8